MSNINLKIAVIRNGLVSNIAHSISQNLIADGLFDVDAHVERYRQLFLEVGVESALVESIVSEGKRNGLHEYVTGLSISGIDGGAQIAPEYNPQVILAAEELASLSVVR